MACCYLLVTDGDVKKLKKKQDCVEDRNRKNLNLTIVWHIPQVCGSYNVRLSEESKSEAHFVCMLGLCPHIFCRPA